MIPDTFMEEVCVEDLSVLTPESLAMIPDKGVAERADKDDGSVLILEVFDIIHDAVMDEMCADSSAVLASLNDDHSETCASRIHVSVEDAFLLPVEELTRTPDPCLDNRNMSVGPPLLTKEITAILPDTDEDCHCVEDTSVLTEEDLVQVPDTNIGECNGCLKATSVITVQETAIVPDTCADVIHVDTDSVLAVEDVTVTPDTCEDDMCVEEDSVVTEGVLTPDTYTVTDDVPVCVENDSVLTVEELTVAPDTCMDCIRVEDASEVNVDDGTVASETSVEDVCEKESSVLAPDASDNFTPDTQLDDVICEDDASVLTSEVLCPEMMCEWMEENVNITDIVDSLENTEDIKPADAVVSDDKTGNVPGTEDGPPDDIRAFFGHPLTAATTAINGEDTHASAVALMHEYINLPTLDDSGAKIGDKINSIYDIMREDTEEKGAPEEETVTPLLPTPQDYIDLIQTTLASDVDKFFNQDGVESVTSVAIDNQNTPIVGDIQEICVETTPLIEEASVNAADIFPHVSPLEAADMQNHSPDTADVSPQEAIVPGDMSQQSVETSPRYEKREHSAIVNARPGTAERKSPVEEKTQDTSKKLFKALTEKILKKRMNQQAKELAPAAVMVTTTPSDINAFIPDQTDMASKISEFSLKREALLDSLNDELTIADDHGEMPGPGQDRGHCSDANTVPSLSVQHPCQVQGRQTHPEGSGNAQCVPLIQPSSCGQAIQTVHSGPRVKSVRKQQPHQHPPQLPPPPPPPPAQLPAVPVPVPAQHNQHNPQYLVSSVTQTPIHPVTSGCSVAPSYPANNGYYCSSNGAPHNGYSYMDSRHSPPVSDDRDIMLERYIHQQNQLFHDHPNFQYPGGAMKENYSMKSPDSGFHEPCSSPPSATNGVFKDSTAQYNGDEPEKVTKRRRSAPSMYVKQYWQGGEKSSSAQIPKLDIDPAGYKYFLESPISTTQRIEEDRITYLNKGQYYGLTLEHSGERLKQQLVKSVIMVVFREDKQLEDERKAWEFWHSRQHSFKQRVIDIDTKNSSGVVPSSIEEKSFNAVAVKWNPRDSPIKVNVAVHCLSTDFSNQKGVKGLPLHIQIDTYDNVKDTTPSSRAFCQIKVFCDKGAERKTRDEERRKQTRIKTETSSPCPKARKKGEDVFHSPLDRSEFYPMADLQTPAVLFSPTFETEDNINRNSPINVVSNDEDGSSSITSSGEHYEAVDDGFYAPFKRQRTDSYSSYNTFSKILLYVREPHESVFTALMLHMPTVQGLLNAIEEKYNIPTSKVKHAFKRSKKGILVKIDDNIVRHYSHESTFVIEFNRVGEEKDCELILTEIDVS